MISIDYTGRIGATCSLRLEAPTKGCKVQARKQKHCSLCQMVWSWDQIAFGAPHSLSVVPDLDPSPSQHPSRSIKGFRRTWLESSYIYHRTPSDLSRMGHFNFFLGMNPLIFDWLFEFLVRWILLAFFDSKEKKGQSTKTPSLQRQWVEPWSFKKF